MEEIIKQLCARFPLLTRLTLAQAGNNAIADNLPPFLGFILAVMDDPPDKPLCFVLPRRGDVARLTAVLHGLHRFIKIQKQLAVTCAEINFKKGDNVRVHPGKQVYRYDGFDEESRDYIWLKTADGTGRRIFNTEKIIPRLEKTTRITPKGKLDSRILSPPPAPLDQLLETSTFGNHSLIRNEVVLLDSRSGFAAFADNVTLQREPMISDMPSLNSLLPFGELSQPSSSKQSWLRKWDDRNPTGEPIVAITHSAESLANFCIDAPAKSKLVVINGLSRLKHRQAYDDMADSQKLVLFASQDEDEMIAALGQAPVPCRFWWLSAAEINTGISINDENGSPGVVNEIVRWANNYERLNVESISCENQGLEKVCIHLEELRGHLTDDENAPLTKLTSRAWRLVNDAAAVIRPLTAPEQKNFTSQIDNLRNELNGNFWLQPETASILANIATGIETSLLPQSKLGINKGAELFRVVRETQKEHLKCALLARNETHVAELKLWLHQRSVSLEVYSPRTLPEESSFDRLICASWPGWHSLKQVADVLVAPRITVLAYPFEGRWLNQCRQRLRMRPDAPAVTSAEKSRFVTQNKNAPSIWVEENPQKPPQVPAIPTDTAIWNFEQRLRAVRKGIAASPTEATETVPARYVGFVGDSYTFLTESHKVPIATELVSGKVRQNQNLPERTVAEIKLGDFVVFPESGDRELVQELADKLIGKSAHDLRKLAHVWKDVLQTSGLSSEYIFAQSCLLNRHRHPVTIRNWLADTTQIGPREKEDLVLIALVTNSNQLDLSIDDVWLAIERLRGAHQRAGKRLRDVLLQRLPQVISQVEERGTQIDLAEFGSAWVVQVDSIASQTEPRGRSEVNRLLREHSSSDLTEFV